MLLIVLLIVFISYIFYYWWAHCERFSRQLISIFCSVAQISFQDKLSKFAQIVTKWKYQKYALVFIVLRPTIHI